MTFIVPESDNVQKTASLFSPLAQTGPFALPAFRGPPVDLLERAQNMQRDMLDAVFQFWMMPLRFLAPGEANSATDAAIAPATTEVAPPAALPVPPAIAEATSEAETLPELAAPKIVPLTAKPAGTPIEEKAPLAQEAIAPDAAKAPSLSAKPKGEPDDLERIIGIGPKLKRMLNELGVWHFQQIASWTADEIAWINAKMSFRGRIEREGWQKQASRLAKEPGKSGPKASSKAA
jgi:predicted flap endonuclease-1-like 5' DNA nuclease